MSTSLIVKELTAEEKERLRQCFSDTNFCKFGADGYILSSSFKNKAAGIKSMRLRPDDVWIRSFPRSGTTMMQEIAWLLNNNLDFEKASKIKLEHRYHFIEQALMDLNDVDSYVNVVHKTTQPEEMPSPRFFYSHLPFEFLPEGLLDTCKVLYVARDPRDVAVSIYHFFKNCVLFCHGDLKNLWELFMDDLLFCPSPYFANVKQAWALRHHPNLLFVFYEDMIKDLPTTMRRISDFYGKKYTDEQIMQLSEHMSFDTFKNNKAANRDYVKETKSSYSKHEFIRKGKSGGWREMFDEEMQARAQQWMMRHLQDTDLVFPPT